MPKIIYFILKLKMILKIELIVLYDTTNKEKGYNVSTGGSAPMYGRKHTEEFKKAMSKRLKGIPLSEEHKSKIGLANKGRKASIETKMKLSEAHKGIKQSEESKRKRSESIKLWWAKRKSIEDIVKS